MAFVPYGFVLVQVQVQQNKKKEEASERTSQAENT
jgi:hypothetical protein